MALNVGKISHLSEEDKSTQLEIMEDYGLFEEAIKQTKVDFKEISKQSNSLIMKMDAFYRSLLCDTPKLRAMAQKQALEYGSSDKLNEAWLLPKKKREAAKYKAKSNQLKAKESRLNEKRDRLKHQQDQAIAGCEVTPVPTPLFKHIQHLIVVFILSIGEVLINVAALAEVGEFTMVQDFSNALVIGLVLGVSAKYVGLYAVRRLWIIGAIFLVVGIVLMGFLVYLRSTAGGHWWFILLNIAIYIITIAVSAAFEKRLSKDERNYLHAEVQMRRLDKVLDKHKERNIIVEDRYRKKINQLTTRARKKRKRTEARDMIISNEELEEFIKILETKNTDDKSYIASRVHFFGVYKAKDLSQNTQKRRV